MTSGKRAAEPSKPAPYLTHDMTHYGRHTLTPADNNGRTRKPKSKKKREERYEEEIQYNLTYRFRGNAHRQGQSTARMQEDGEYPPPPAYETATAVSTLVSEDFVHQNGPPHPVQPSDAISVPSTPVVGSRFLQRPSNLNDAPYMDTVSVSSLRPQSEEDGSSVELVDIEPSERWEMERQRGLPLNERLKRHRLRTEATTPSPIPHRARLVSQPTTRGPGSHARFLASQLSLRIPEDHDHYEDDRTRDNSDLSTPPTPKHHKLPGIPASPSRFFHVRSQSPQPSSSVISLLRNPNPFFKSTPSLLTLSPSLHGDHHRSRTKLFHRKPKERASSEPLDDWEILERTESTQSSIDGSLPPPSPPPVPQKHGGQQLPRSSTPEVFGGDQPLPVDDRSRKGNTFQMSRTVGQELHPARPASPPFVARHVRRHTTSSRGGQMTPSSAPVSPISASPASTFSTSTISLAQNTIDDDNIPMPIQSLANWNYPVTRSPPRATVTGGSGSSSASRTPRVSSPAPPTIVPYEHDPDMPIFPNPSYGTLPARSATERIVRVSDVRDEGYAVQRGRSLSREMGMRSAPAYSTIFPSGPPTPLPNSSQSLPPPSTSPSPRRHYPGRPLPQTPPMSPSLTWILDKGKTQVTPHPRALVSSAPRTPPIPEGLLIDLDDDSLDSMAPGPSNPPQNPGPITPLCMDFLDDDEDEDDNASDSGTVSPPGPLTPTTTGFASASSVSLSTIASRSEESLNSSMRQATPTSDVPDISGLVNGLGDQSLSDGSDYDALLLIADLIGPANSQPHANSPENLHSSYLIGNVELERRRVTRDGRVKLKMSLLGVSVERCAICMSQFKHGDRGILGAKCKHVFHEKCLASWLARNQTCPLCRERLDVCD